MHSSKPSDSTERKKNINFGLLNTEAAGLPLPPSVSLFVFVFDFDKFDLTLLNTKFTQQHKHNHLITQCSLALKRVLTAGPDYPVGILCTCPGAHATSRPMQAAPIKKQNKTGVLFKKVMTQYITNKNDIHIFLT